jgi:hypothetical protein
MARDRTRWQHFIDVLCPIRNNRNWWWWWWCCHSCGNFGLLGKKIRI